MKATTMLGTTDRRNRLSGYLSCHNVWYRTVI